MICCSHQASSNQKFGDTFRMSIESHLNMTVSYPCVPGICPKPLDFRCDSTQEQWVLQVNFVYCLQKLCLHLLLKWNHLIFMVLWEANVYGLVHTDSECKLENEFYNRRGRTVCFYPVPHWSVPQYDSCF